MIKKEGDYYVIDTEDNMTDKEKMIEAPRVNEKQKVIETIGDIPAYLKQIGERVNQIKKVKIEQRKRNENQTVFDKLGMEEKEEPKSLNKIHLEMKIPTEVYELDHRLRTVQNKINTDEIFRQKVQRKGTMTERVKTLNLQLQKLLQKSPEIIINNIQSYCLGLDDKQLSMKLIYLHECFTNTQGIHEEIEVLEKYLQNLKSIQTKLKGMTRIEGIVNDHEGLVQKRAELSSRIHKMFAYMKEEYEAVCKEIDEL